MKTILWFCNRPVEGSQDRRTGTWFTTMARALDESGAIRLAIVGQAKVKSVVRSDLGGIAQWCVPYEPLGRDGLPSRRTVEAIRQVADEVAPDLIHIWGGENYWGLLTARGLLAGPSVLEMQGIKYVYAKVYYGGLSLNERIRCIGLLETLRPERSLFLGKRKFERWGRFEKEMILGHRYISTQSDWVRAHVLSMKPECALFNTGMMLRVEFFGARPWTLRKSDAPSIFASSSGPTAYKGLHVLVRAAAILKRKYPRLVLTLAGDIVGKGIRKSGYVRWLQSEVRRLSMDDSVRWLGPLDADEIIRQYHQAAAVVVPSFIETYSLALAEAMVVGVPAVASYAGALPELASDGESALFFPPGDEVACAWQIDRILSDPALASRLSQAARRKGLARNEPSAVVERQLGIYDEILRDQDRR